MEWIALLIALAVLLAIDLLIVRGRDGAMSLRAASIWSVAWIAISLVFAGVLYVAGDPARPRATWPATWSRSRCRWTTSSCS